MNLSLASLRKKFEEGALSKSDFIRSALNSHQTLFDYVDITRSTDVKEILITEDGVSFVIGDQNVRLYCPRNEARVAPIEVMNFGQYEPVETLVMEFLARDSRNILDVGANIGLYSIQLAKRFPNAKVYAFEPMPTSCAYLQRNIAANFVGGQVSSFNYGLSETSGTVEFFASPTNGTNASLKNVANADDAVAIVGLTLTLDQWCKNQAVAPDFIKCDVEGAELLVFRGGRATLEQHRPIVFSELLRKWSKPFGYHPNDVIDFFEEIGYLCFAIGAEGVRSMTKVTDSTQETNYAFLHVDAHVQAIDWLKAYQ